MRYLLFIVFTVAACTPAYEQTASSTSATSGAINSSKPVTVNKFNKLNNEYIIHIESNFSIQEQEKYLGRYNINIISKLTKNNYLVRVIPNIGIDAITEKIKASKYIKYIQVNSEYQIMK